MNFNINNKIIISNILYNCMIVNDVFRYYVYIDENKYPNLEKYHK